MIVQDFTPEICVVVYGVLFIYLFVCLFIYIYLFILNLFVYI